MVVQGKVDLRYHQSPAFLLSFCSSILRECELYPTFLDGYCRKDREGACDAFLGKAEVSQNPHRLLLHLTVQGVPHHPGEAGDGFWWTRCCPLQGSGFWE